MTIDVTSGTKSRSSLRNLRSRHGISSDMYMESLIQKDMSRIHDIKESCTDMCIHYVNLISRWSLWIKWVSKSWSTAQLMISSASNSIRALEMTKWQSNTQQTSTLHFLENIGKKTLVYRGGFALWGVGVTVRQWQKKVFMPLELAKLWPVMSTSLCQTSCKLVGLRRR